MIKLSGTIPAALGMAGVLSALSPVAQAQQASETRLDSMTIEQIIVTAQKRDERAIDVPVAISAVSADALTEQNIVQMSDYYSRVPGLQFAGDETYALSLRGVTTGGGTNPTLAILVDEIPFGSTTFLGLGNSRFPDFDPSILERIEVLRGPQGTLYGASSLGGLIKYVTRKPDTNRFYGRVEGGWNTVEDGDTGWMGRGSLNIPLASDRAAILLSGFTREDPPYTDNVRVGNEAKDVNEARTSGGFASLLFKPLDTLSFTLTGLYQERDAKFASGIQVEADPLTQAPTYVPTFGKHAVSLADTSDVGEQQFYSGRIEWDAGPVQVTSLTSWGRSEGTNFNDLTAIFGFLTNFYGAPAGAGVRIEDASDTDKFVQELRIGGSASRFDWRTGLFYTKEEGTVAQTLKMFGSATATPYSGSGIIEYEEYAAFGDVTVHITDQWDIQLGMRYARNDQSYQSISAVDAPVVPVFGPPGATTPVESDDSTITWAFSPTYRFNPDLMAYFRVATGYRPGGPNTEVGNIPRTYDSDSVINYELGLKGYLSGLGVSFDVALFQIDWKDIQLQNTDSATQFLYFDNGEDARSRGIEASASWRPVDGLTLEANGTLLDAELTAALPAIAGSDYLVGASGDRLPASAKFTSNLSAQYDFPLAATIDAFVGANWSYIGERKSTFMNSAAFAQGAQRFDWPSYSVVDLRTGLRIDEAWSVNLYARNVLDEDGVIVADNRGGTNVPLVTFLQPRTYGLSVSWDF